MNRRIRRKKAKRYYRDAALEAISAATLRAVAQRLPVTGPITEGLRHRALFRARRYEAEAADTLRYAMRLAR